MTSAPVKNELRLSGHLLAPPAFVVAGMPSAHSASAHFSPSTMKTPRSLAMASISSGRR